ncbi:MAG: GGDEF domain-containing protein [Campylobacterales bacterium]
MVDARKKKRREISKSKDSKGTNVLDMNEPANDIEIYSQEVLNTLITDNLPPTPNNFAVYFDKLLEDKSENLRKQVHSILELEDDNDDENAVVLEQSLKEGFNSMKNILDVTATLFKNMSLMSKILEKRKKELMAKSDSQTALRIAKALGSDVDKLNKIFKKQSSQIKTYYENTAKVFKKVEGETIFDNKYGVYNKRYLLEKITKEIESIREFKYSSSLLMIELSRELILEVKSDKITMLMTKTIARLLLKTSRRSDIVAHYGRGVFAMLLKHTDLESAKKASERLIDLVSNSNLFLADKEIKLKISIGIADVDGYASPDEIIVNALDGIEIASKQKNIDYAVAVKDD